MSAMLLMNCSFRNCVANICKARTAEGLTHIYLVSFTRQLSPGGVKGRRNPAMLMTQNCTSLSCERNLQFHPPLPILHSCFCSLHWVIFRIAKSVLENAWKFGGSAWGGYDLGWAGSLGFEEKREGLGEGNNNNNNNNLPFMQVSEWFTISRHPMR